MFSSCLPKLLESRVWFVGSKICCRSDFLGLCPLIIWCYDKSQKCDYMKSTAEPSSAHFKIKIDKVPTTYWMCTAIIIIF